jgi:hypothetical protein
MQAHRVAHLVSLAVLAALTAVLLAACGGSNKLSGKSSSGSSPEAFVTSNADKYPACMRDHGVTNFPDPQVNGNHLTLQITPSIIASPAFKSAQKTCAYLLPAGAGQTNGPSPAQQKARTEGLLAFAACIRKHGFARFPDPTSQGQLTLEMIRQAGIDLQQPALLQAGDVCVSASHGQITKGDVAQAVANPGASGSRSSTSG